MVWSDILDEMQLNCKKGAICGLESGLCYTSADQGLALTGFECIKIQSIVKAIDKNSPTNNITAGGIDYKLVNNSKEKKTIEYENKDDVLIIFYSKMIIFIALFDKLKRVDGYTAVKEIHEDFIYRGM